MLNKNVRVISYVLCITFMLHNIYKYEQIIIIIIVVEFIQLHACFAKCSFYIMEKKDKNFSRFVFYSKGVQDKVFIFLQALIICSDRI